MLPPITPLSFDSLLESLPEINSTVFDEMYIYCTPTGILAHNMGCTGEKTEQQLAVNLGFARVQNSPHGKRAGRFPGQLKASSSFLRTPRDHGLNRVIILVCGLSEIGVEAEVPDAQSEVVSAGVTVLLLPDAAAFDQAAAWRAAENTVRGGHGILTFDRLHRDIDVEGQGGDRTDAFGSLDVSGFEFDAVGGHCFAPFLVLQ